MNISRIERVVESGPQVLYDADAPTRAVDSDGARWPEPPAAEAFHGLAGEIVRAIEPHSEADPAALLFQTLIAFGSVVGRGPHFLVEGKPHRTNLFCVLVGETSKARKGTSWGRIADIFSRIDPAFEKRVRGGVSSGEGIVHAVRDPAFRKNRAGQEVLDDGGVEDKRIILLEAEFSLLLSVIRREGNTASETLRCAWDGNRLETLAKNSHEVAEGAHISVIGHTTKTDLLRHLDSTDIVNGFANRFLFVCTRRSKCLPEGGSVPQADLDKIAAKLKRAVDFSSDVNEMRRDDEARALWGEVYPTLSEGRPGLLGSATSRSEAQTLRLSMIFALLSSSAVIRREHLLAALGCWDFCFASARHIFGDSLGDPVADEILSALRGEGRGLTRTGIRDLFKRHRTEAEITAALALLERLGKVEMQRKQSGGRAAEIWFFRNTAGATKATEATEG
jgi:hypothetical protein